jgi:hypothetical protein
VFKKVNDLKCFSACEKSTEYIVEKLKELGINEERVGYYSKEDLIDIMESLN